jgi:hypothetical protein
VLSPVSSPVSSVGPSASAMAWPTAPATSKVESAMVSLPTLNVPASFLTVTV